MRMCDVRVYVNVSVQESVRLCNCIKLDESHVVFYAWLNVEAVCRQLRTFEFAIRMKINRFYVCGACWYVRCEYISTLSTVYDLPLALARPFCRCV